MCLLLVFLTVACVFGYFFGLSLFPACYASHAFAALVLIGGVVGLLTCFVAAVWWDKKKQLLAFIFMSAGRFF
jgi:hypothetical protein